MTESLRLPLRLPPSKDQDHDSLQSRIFQIYSKKGAFRNVTEASLINDIKSQKQQNEDTKMDEADDSESEEPENRNQMVIQSREELMQQLR
jgi:mediator of RNA polymerase II transcription subunit 17, fungi type